MEFPLARSDADGEFNWNPDQASPDDSSSSSSNPSDSNEGSSEDEDSEIWNDEDVDIPLGEAVDNEEVGRALAEQARRSN